MWRFFLTRVVIVVTSLTASVSALPCAFQYAASETRVLCDNRRLTKIPPVLSKPGGISGNDDVDWLDLSNNNITSGRGLEQPRFSDLRHLDFRNNLLPAVSEVGLGHVPKLEWLDLSDNHLGSVEDGAFCALRGLGWLNLAGCGLTSLSPRSLSGLTSLSTLYLSHNALRQVPGLTLKPMKNLRHLDLSSNNLEQIMEEGFAGLTNLQTLRLSENKITRLTAGAFRGLTNLKTLNVGNNRLLLTSYSFPPRVFKYLPTLESLYMAGNDKQTEGQYPLEVFDDVASLKFLAIDTFYDTTFNRSFASLRNLTHLDVGGGFCKMAVVKNSTFLAFKNSSLEYLSLSDCNIGKMERCSFCHMPKLHTLGLRHNSHLTIDTALRALYGLQNQSMKLIDLRSNHLHIRTAVIDKTNSRYLGNICLETLYLGDSLLGSISLTSFHDFRGPLVDCMNNLDISFNVISEWELVRLIRKIMIRMKHLKILKIQGQKIFEAFKGACLTRTKNSCRGHTSYMLSGTLYLPVPPSLQMFNASGTSGHIYSFFQTMALSGGGNLTTLDASFVGIDRCDFELQGGEALQDLSLAGNNCRLMSGTFFDSTPNLRRLVLANVQLDPLFMKTNGKRLFRGLAKLEELDLSSNFLTRLQSDFLSGHSRLKKLNLANNRFREIPIDLSLHPQLSELDMSYNLLASLTARDTAMLEDTASRHEHFTLHLRGNILTCTCTSLTFVSWLSTTSVRLDGENDNRGYDEDYDDNGRVHRCVTETGEPTSTKAILVDWDFHWRRCMGPHALWLSVSLLALLLLGLAVSLLLVRNWTHVIYVLHALRNYRMPRRINYRKDAYLVYAENDYLLAEQFDECLRTRREVRLLLRYREERLGSTRAENIIQHIDDSWKVLVNVTRTMAQDEWVGFALHQALRAITDTMPNRVIILFRDNPRQIPHMESFEMLLRMVPERMVFHLPRNADSNHPLWNQIAKAILDEAVYK